MNRSIFRSFNADRTEIKPDKAINSAAREEENKKKYVYIDEKDRVAVDGAAVGVLRVTGTINKNNYARTHRCV